MNTANQGRMGSFFARERMTPSRAQMGKCTATPASCVRPSCESSSGPLKEWGEAAKGSSQAIVNNASASSV